MEYRGYKYSLRPDGAWTLIFPDGTKMRAVKQSEEQLKKEIDQHIEQGV